MLWAGQRHRLLYTRRKTDTGYFPKVVVNNNQTQDLNQGGWAAEKTHVITTLNHHPSGGHSPSGRKTRDCRPSLALRGWVALGSGHWREGRATLGREARPHACSDVPSLSFPSSAVPHLTLPSGAALLRRSRSKSHPTAGTA